MITYVNSVFVSNSTESALATSIDVIKDGQFIIVDVDTNEVLTAANIANASRIKIGMGTGNKVVSAKTGAKTIAGVKWSNIINIADIKSYTETVASNDNATSEDKVFIDFANLDSNLLAKFAEGGLRIVVRLTFKDLPTRFRKWTESYEYVTIAGDDNASIASNIAAMITKQWKRARVVATVGTVTKNAETGAITFAEGNNGTSIQLEAMQYDDDNSVDSINWANKVRFNANVYYTNPAADGWESNNKHFPLGVEISKVPGNWYTADAKLVRDRESQAMGYEGILNRGEGTWPIIKPAMRTDLSKTYNAITLEFENMYRTADDLFRKTKQTVEVYCSGSQFDAVKAALSAVNPAA